MKLHTILVVTDLSSAELAAVHRATQLATQHRAALRLMYLPSPGFPAVADGAKLLAETARQLQEDPELRVRSMGPGAATLDEVARQAASADLIIMCRRHRTPSLLVRQPIMRLLRSCPCPVLVTGISSERAYERLLVAVDLSDESRALVDIAAIVAPSARIEVFHAACGFHEHYVRLSRTSSPHLVARHHERLRWAREDLVELTAGATYSHRLVHTVTGHGDPAQYAAIHQQHIHAGLVVAGKHASSRIEDLIFGSVAQRLLKWTTSDILLVPQSFMETARRPRSSGRSVAHPGKHSHSQSRAGGI